MGRPLTEYSVMATFKINPNTLATVDEIAEDEEVTRSEQLRRLVDLGLAAWKGGTR